MDKKNKKVKPIKQKGKEKGGESTAYGIRGSTFNIDGVDNVILSAITQKVLGCVVGEHITSENPWIHVNKEAIEDNLELHELSSEFLPIRDLIKVYPENEILIGYDRSANVTDAPEERAFYICTSIAAKNAIINMLESEKKEHEELLRKKMEKIATSWISFGSETEVEELNVKDLRPQLHVEITRGFPAHRHKKYFKQRRSEEMRSGYVELLPGRFSINSVYRKRVDASVQVAPHLVEDGCQTAQEISKNRTTQYQYIYQALDYNDFIEDMSLFMRTMVRKMTHLLVSNFCFNLYSDDYTFLKTRDIINFSYNLENIVSFRDVITCKETKVSALTWHPLMSGIIAAAYRLYPDNLRHREEIHFTQEDELRENVVLIWCETDPINAKIKLESPKEINCLEFCPFNYEFLIGGCSNGQVIVWDLTNKLEELENAEVLTHQQLNNRTLIHDKMTWMKIADDAKSMRPTIISNTNNSHVNSVTAISWLRPECFVDIIGHVHTSFDIQSLQFLTSARGNRIFLWDLKQRPRWEEEKAPKKKIERPAKLTENISPFRVLNHQFSPKYKIILGTGKVYLPITCMVLDSYKYQYRPIVYSDLEDARRTYFEQIQPEPDTVEEFKPNFLVATCLGGITTGSWAGLSFNQGVECHQEHAEINPVVTIHDGPVVACRLNPHYPEYFLTVGGRVFAVWNRNNINRPVFWRKATIQYVSGAWVPYNPFGVILARSDLIFEHCTILTSDNSSKIETRSRDASILGLHIENGKDHVMKNKFAVSNTLGAIRLNRFPEPSDQQKAMLMKSRDTLLQVLNNTQLLASKNKNLKKPTMSITSEHEDADLHSKVSNTIITAKIDLQRARDWEKLEQIIAAKNENSDEFQIYDVILKKKQINLNDLLKQKGPLKEMLQNEMATEIKFRQILAKKPKIFQTEKNSLISKVEYKKKNKIFVTAYDKTEISAMKHAYLSNYKAVEDESMHFIKRRPHKVSFNWNAMVQKGKTRRSFNL